MEYQEYLQRKLKRYGVKNIFDLTGNTYEWTIDVYDIGSRVKRGVGYYSMHIYYTRLSYRNYHEPTVSKFDNGSYIVLYQYVEG